MKHIQKYNELNIGDYVFLLKDELNGFPIKDISKEIFIIQNFQRRRRFSRSLNTVWCLIKPGSHKYIITEVWVNSNVIRKAKDIEIATIKYNL